MIFLDKFGFRQWILGTLNQMAKNEEKIAKILINHEKRLKELEKTK